MRASTIGVYGLGVMGRSLAKNFIRHGFSTAVYSKSEKEREDFQCSDYNNWCVCGDERELVATIACPRVIFLMITAGKPVDSVIETLLPLLNQGDVIIDGGNSFYQDTNRRCKKAEAFGVSFLGVGVSGGEKGALEGPCMMVGGHVSGWKISRNLLETICAKAPDGAPCCAYVGAEGAGHYVKMVHNGIEYAIMQQISDIYGLMRDGMKMSAADITKVFRDWQHGPLNSYLVDIAVKILKKRDEKDGEPLLDRVLDVAHQKGTGCWSVLEAAQRGIYVPCIDEALFTRFFSEECTSRSRGRKLLKCTSYLCEVPTFQQLEQALLLSIVCSYTQGIALISKASDTFGWNIDLPLTVSLWRNGCIIRSALLETITAALRRGEKLILLADEMKNARDAEPALRTVSLYSTASGIPAPAVTAAMIYYDQYRIERMNVNMVQALRDCFGAHTYERTDTEGVFHTDWES